MGASPCTRKALLFVRLSYAIVWLFESDGSEELIVALHDEFVVKLNMLMQLAISNQQSDRVTKHLPSGFECSEVRNSP